MLSIKLKRIGGKKKPFYNIIVSDKLSYIKGKYNEKLGFFDPIKRNFFLNKERIYFWIKNGADVSKRVKNLLEIKNESL